MSLNQSELRCTLYNSQEGSALFKYFKSIDNKFESEMDYLVEAYKYECEIEMEASCSQNFIDWMLTNRRNTNSSYCFLKLSFFL